MTSAPKWTYYRWAAHHPDLLAGAQGCGRHSLICNTPDRVRPLLRIAATEVGHLPRLVAAGSHALPSAHGLCVSVAVRQPIPTLAGACAWRVAWVPCAAYIPPGMHHPGARSTHRPQAVVIPRLSHLGWPRMRGVASVCSHYARIAGEPAGHADQTGLPDPVWRSRRWPMGRRAAAVPGSWEHLKLALIYVLLNLSTKGCYASHGEAGRRLPLARLML